VQFIQHCGKLFHLSV